MPSLFRDQQAGRLDVVGVTRALGLVARVAHEAPALALLAELEFPDGLRHRAELARVELGAGLPGGRPRRVSVGDEVLDPFARRARWAWVALRRRDAIEAPLTAPELVERSSEVARREVRPEPVHRNRVRRR